MITVNTEQELIEYRNKLGYNYSLDEFVEDYRIGKTNAKKYLKAVRGIKLTQGLFLEMKKQYPETIQHKNYYNENEIFETLLDKGIIRFQFRKLVYRFSDMESKILNDWYQKEMKTYDIPYTFVKEHQAFFKYDCLQHSPTPGEVSKMFSDEPKSYERAVNNKETSIVTVIGNTKRYKVLLDNHDKLDHIISWNIINAIKDNK